MSQIEQPKKPQSEYDHEEETLKKSDGGGVLTTTTVNCARREITEALGEKVVSRVSNSLIFYQLAVIAAQYTQPAPLAAEGIFDGGNITIGEALEATALTSGDRPVDYSDAAAIQAAEVRATGRTNIVPGGVAAAAQSAATRNARATRDEEKTKLSEVLAEATTKLPADKPVTRRDAEGVIGAELRNDPNLTTRPGGVAASLAAAARLNQSNMMNNQNK